MSKLPSLPRSPKVVYKKAFDTSRARRSVPQHISVQNQVAFLRKDARRKKNKKNNYTMSMGVHRKENVFL